MSGAEVTGVDVDRKSASGIGVHRPDRLAVDAKYRLTAGRSRANEADRLPGNERPPQLIADQRELDRLLGWWLDDRRRNREHRSPPSPPQKPGRHARHPPTP